MSSITGETGKGNSFFVHSPTTVRQLQKDNGRHECKLLLPILLSGDEHWFIF